MGIKGFVEIWIKVTAGSGILQEKYLHSKLWQVWIFLYSKSDFNPKKAPHKEKWDVIILTWILYIPFHDTAQSIWLSISTWFRVNYLSDYKFQWMISFLYALYSSKNMSLRTLAFHDSIFWKMVHFTLEALFNWYLQCLKN